MDKKISLVRAHHEFIPNCEYTVLVTGENNTAILRAGAALSKAGIDVNLLYESTKAGIPVISYKGGKVIIGKLSELIEDEDKDE